VTALAQTVKAAKQHAYAVVDQIKIDGSQHRTDIGFRAVIG